MEAGFYFLIIILIIGVAVYSGILKVIRSSKSSIKDGLKKRSFQKTVGDTKAGKLAMQLYLEYEELDIRAINDYYPGSEKETKLYEFIQSMATDEVAGVFRVLLKSNNVKMQRLGIHGIYFLYRDAETAWEKEQEEIYSWYKHPQRVSTEIDSQKWQEEYDNVRLRIAAAAANPLHKIGAIEPLLDIFSGKNTDKDIRKDAEIALLQAAKLGPIEGKSGFINIYQSFLKNAYHDWDHKSTKYAIAY